jgi:adenylyltransferase/sulfurtransferase
MDVVISCLDNRLARRAVNLACNRVRVPWVDGAIESLDGLVRVFSSRQPETACYECALTAQDYALLDLHYTCPPSTIRAAEGLSPTTPTAAAIIGAMETQEAVKLLHDMETRLGCVTYFSGQTLRTTEMQYGYKADCPAHQTYNTIIELPTGTAHMTGGELLSAVADQVGEVCFPLLPRTLLTVLTCPQCGHTEERYRPQLGQAQRGIPCAQCGAENDFGRTNTVSPHGREADLPLTQIGFPPLAIIPFRGQINTYLIELTGDVAEMFPDTMVQSER